MKTTLLFLLTAFIYLNSYTQVSFDDHIVTTDVNFPYAAYAADLDGDGDMDVLSASGSDDKIAWYENTDGIGTFGPQQIITTNADGANCVYAADLDGDGDMDVLSTSIADDIIAWYENTDGQGNFGPKDTIAIVDWPENVLAADLDGDGDMDVISDSWTTDIIVWFENTDGQGVFGVADTITANIDGIRNIAIADIDGDDDLDVLSASTFDNKIAWYENTDGSANFGAQQVIGNPSDAEFVCTGDIDGDGDMDVLSASGNDGIISWYENTDGQGNFGVEQVITTEAVGAKKLCVADLDVDGDLDVLATSYNQDVTWYENTDGQGTFGPQEDVSNIGVSGAYSISATDFDGDSDLDVLTTSLDDNQVSWYENLIFSGLNDNAFASFHVYPNPNYGNIFYIESQKKLIQVEIYNQFGQIVYSSSNFSECNKNAINTSKLGQGVYFVKCKTKDEEIGIEKIVKH